MDLLRHLRHFAAVAEELHFGRAADRLGMAQPPLSQSVQRLERELGVRLFERDSRRVSITAAGRVLLPDSLALLEQSDRLLDSVRQARRGGPAGFRVAVPPGLAPGRVAALLQAFSAAEPDVPLDITELAPAAQRTALRSGHLDVAVLPAPSDDPSLVSGDAVYEPLGVVVAAQAPLAHLPAAHLSDLGEAPLVTVGESGNTEERHLQDRCVRGGYRPARVLHVGGQSVALAMVMAGQAVALLPRSSLPAGHELRWIPLLGDPLSRQLVPVWRSSLDPDLSGAFADALGRAFQPAPQRPGESRPSGRRPSSSVLL